MIVRGPLDAAALALAAAYAIYLIWTLVAEVRRLQRARRHAELLAWEAHRRATLSLADAIVLARRIHHDAQLADLEELWARPCATARSRWS